MRGARLSNTSGHGNGAAVRLLSWLYGAEIGITVD